MQLCVITPLSHLDLASYGSGIHMALTHLVLKDDEYVRAYARFQNKDEYVILDNSAFEMEQQGKGLDPLPVLKSAKKIGANEVIATDVLLDGDATVVSTRDFIKEYRQFFGEEIRLGRPVPKIMAVPQGKTIEEWIDCYMRLIVMDGVDVLGFSKISVPTAFGGLNARNVDGGVTQSRLKLYNYLDDKQLWPYCLRRLHIDIHLLGGDSWSGYELKNISSYNQSYTEKSQRDLIRSNDTSAPVWYGAQGVSFDPFTGKAAKFISEKPDLENERQETSEKIDGNISIIMKNISVLHKCSNWK